MDGTGAYAHDHAGRLLSVDGPWEIDTIAYGYDALGRLTNREINGDAMRWQFDGLGRVEAVDNPLGHFDHQYETAASPLLTRVAAPAGLEILYGYGDVLGDRRLSAITNLVNSVVVSAFGYKYDQADRIKEWAVAQASAATTMIVGHDSLDRLRSVVARDSGSGALLQDYAYTYDPAGNRLTEKIGSSLSKATHNDLNQMMSISRGSTVEFGGSVNEPANVKVNDQPTLAWSNNLFSAAVTNLSQGSNTVMITAADGSANTATNYYRVVVDPAASVALGYDPDGNMLTNVVAGSLHLYTWDSRSRLSKITRGSDVTEFAYDGLGRRVEIIELTGATTNAVRRFLWAALEIVEERDSANTTAKRYYTQGFQTENGQTESFLYTKDHLGSIREVIDGTGTVAASYCYDPWGRMAKLAGDLDSDFLFTGHFYHAASALHLAPYRAYSANLGRWLMRDPIEEEGGPILYGYVANAPVDYFDPYGLFESSAWMRATVPGQVAWDNAVTAAEQGDWGNAAANAALMLAEQALFAATLGEAAALTQGAKAVCPAVSSSSKEAAKRLFDSETKGFSKRVIRDRTTGRIKGVGAGKASYRPKGQGEYSVTPQSGKAADTQHFRPTPGGGCSVN